MTILDLEIWSQTKNDFKKIVALLYYFYTEIGRSVSKIC